MASSRLSEDVLAVVVHRMDADTQQVRNLNAGKALGNKRKNFSFSVAHQGEGYL